MIQPPEMKLNLGMSVANHVHSTTGKVWEILTASYNGNLAKVQSMVIECPELINAQYNYAPPIHFAVTEQHPELVRFLLEKGALDISYKNYPFLDSLLSMAEDRENNEIVSLLKEYHRFPERSKYKGDCGEIFYERTDDQIAFQDAVDKEQIDKVKSILKDHPEFVKDPTWFWGEGIMMMPAKEKNFALLEVLMDHGAKVPTMTKWCRYYYFEKYESAEFLIKNGMDANHHSWHEVSLLHDMVHEGSIEKATLLLDNGANINAIDKEYHSTPLGFAAKWGQLEMVKLLLDRGANINRSGAKWATPLAWARKKQHTEIEKLLLSNGATH